MKTCPSFDFSLHWMQMHWLPNFFNTKKLTNGKWQNASVLKINLYLLSSAINFGEIDPLCHGGQSS
jgi:hypothetical protein